VLSGLFGGTIASPSLAAAASAGTTPQTISFEPPYDGSIGDSITLHASVTSSLAVHFSLATTTACKLNTTTALLTFVGPGSCAVTASQPGNATWAPAPSVTKTLQSELGYTASWGIKTPNGTTRAAGNIEVGDQLSVAIAADDGTAVKSCDVWFSTAGGWYMSTSGDISAGKCTVSTTVPALDDPSIRQDGDRIDNDLCVSFWELTFADTTTRSMDAKDRDTPGGTNCNNGSDGSGSYNTVLDFQLVDGGTPQPFVSDPDMVSWNPADWVGYTPLEFGQSAHLELPAFATSCSFMLNGDWDTVITPAAPSGCSPWDIRLPGILPATLVWQGGSGDWLVEVVAHYSTASGSGMAIGYENMSYAPSDGVFESNQPAVFPTDLATTRFVTVGDEWTPSFKVSGASPSDCQLDVIESGGTDAWYSPTSIDADGTCHYSVPPLTSVGESHQFFVYADTDLGTVNFGGTITAVEVPSAPVISNPGSGGAGTTIDVAPGAGQGLLLDLSVSANSSSSSTSTTPSPGAAVDANPAVSSCSARTLSADLANGGSIPDIAASCKLPPGTYTATAHMYDVTGKITTSKRQFVVYPPSTYHPVTPVRVLDTRKSIGLSGKLKAGVARTFQITGLHGIPAGATAITANATVVNSGAASSIYLGPAPIAKPSTYTLSFNKGQVANRGVTVALSPAGALSVTYRASSGTTDLVLDVTGYFSPAAGGDTYHALTPARVLDTRKGIGLSGKLKANTPRTFTVWGHGGVPKGAKAVTGNVTVVNSTTAWAVYLGPAPVTKPAASTINFIKGQVAGNSQTVALSSTGTLSATFMGNSGATTDLVFDVTGYYTADATGLRYVPLPSASLLDTRTGTGLTGKFSANTPRTLAVRGHAGVPTSAAGITGVVSVVNQTAPYALGVGPVAAAKPTTSALNFLKGDVCSNGLTVALSSKGTLSATYMAAAGKTTDVVIFVTGYFVK
jgi:hypothetical protein